MFRKIASQRAALFLLVFGMALLAPAQAADKEDKEDKAKQVSWVRMALEQKESAVEKLKQAPLSKKGVDTCVNCHDEENEYPVFPIFMTKHAVKADPRSPFGHENKQCESCHGAGGDHTKAKKSEKRAGNIINFGRNAWTPVKDQNEKCLTCHQTHKRIDWKGSTHAFNEVACASCHTVHAARDPVLNRQTQAKVCYACHASEQAKFQQASHHPVREGRMACSECHDTHGENGSGLKVKATAREKCTSCHAEKRGPFLWEHAPAAEDCNACHSPHGSSQPALLKKRVPQLCQECHSPDGHPSASLNGSRLSRNMFMGAKSCLNCHSAVHGSNHPSGVTQLR